MSEKNTDFWKLRLKEVRKELEKNNFEAFVAENIEEARILVTDRIVPAVQAKSVAWGGSTTVHQVGLYEALKDGRFGFQVYDTFDRVRGKPRPSGRGRIAGTP